MALTLIEKLQRFIFGDPDNKNYGAINGDYKVISDLTVMQKMRELAGIGEGDATHLYPKWNNTLKTYVASTDSGLGDKDERIPDGTTTGDMIAWNSVTQVYDKKTAAQVLAILGVPAADGSTPFLVCVGLNGSSAYALKDTGDFLALLGLEGDATHLFPQWDEGTSKFVMLTQAEMVSALGLS